LWSQIATSSEEYGGRRYLPYVFTEQGIAMLSAAMLFERISAVELKQLEFQKKTEEKFDEVFEYISDHAEPLGKEEKGR